MDFDPYSLDPMFPEEHQRPSSVPHTMQTVQPEPQECQQLAPDECSCHCWILVKSGPGKLYSMTKINIVHVV